MSLAHLQVTGLYVIIFVRDDPPKKDDFHWGLYLHQNPAGGTKYHIKDEGSGWIVDHGLASDILKSFLLVGLFRIADVPAGWEGYVDRTLRTYDNQINVPGMTFRVWVLWVLELLKKELSGYTVLKCTNLATLEREIKDWGNTKAPGAAINTQPRPIAASLICGL